MRKIAPTANLLKSLESRPKGGVTRIHPSAPAGCPPVRHSGGSVRSEKGAREDGTASTAGFRPVSERLRGNASNAGVRGRSGRRANVSAGPLRPPGTSVPAADLLASAGGEGRLPQPGRLHPSPPFLLLTLETYF